MPISPAPRGSLARLRGMFGVEPAPLDVLRGLRAATATVLPFAVAAVWHYPALGWMALGGWLTALADTGGTYAARARAMAGFALGGALASALGVLAGRSAWAAVPLAFAWCLCASTLRVWGASGATVGSLLSVAFCAALGRPGGAREALSMAGLLLAGAAWAMVLALVLWPLHPHRPARRATEACFAALARYARALGAQAGRATPVGDEGWLMVVRTEPRRVREALEEARRVGAATRSRRPGTSDEGDRLRVLVESADQLFGALVALAEELESGADGGGAEATHALARALAELADALDALAGAVDAFGRAPNLAALDTAVAGLGVVPRGDALTSLHRAHAGVLLRRAAVFAHAAGEATARTDAGSPSPPRAAPGQARPASPWGELRAASPWALLRAALAPDSFVLQHALRIAVAAACCVALTSWFRISHGTWVTLTAVVVLQPYAGVTLRRGVQRIAGSVLGGVVAALLVATVHAPWLTAALMFPLSIAAVALQPVSYALFTLFLTPVFVLMAERGPGDWQLAGLRAVNTVLGGLFALAAAYVLWPAWERRRLPAELAASLAADREYLGAALALLRKEPGASVAKVRAARRRVGLAYNNAEASLQRRLGEPGHVAALSAEASALLTYGRRFVGSVTALAEGAPAGARAPADLADVAARLDAALADLEDSVAQGRAPGPAPRMPERPAPAPGDDALVAAQLGRIARQLVVMHATVARLVAVTPAGDGDGARG